MHQYIVIEILNKEPLKIGAGGNKANQTEPSKDYIPGSTIRGAVIGELVRKDMFNEKRREILSQIEFYNAYPYRHGSLYMPTPQHLRMDKHKWREKKIDMDTVNKGEIRTIPLANLLDDDLKKDRNPLEYRFVAIKGSYLVGTKVVKEYRLHHNTSRRLEQEERENLFRYQAIAAGQLFRALIRFDQSLENCIRSVLQQTSTFYLGGAKGSGYGLCYMQTIGGPLSDYKEAKRLVGLYDTSDLQPTGQLIITCLSDCLCRNEYGQPVNYIPENHIKEICGQNVKLRKQFIQAGMTEGYNRTWEARYPKEATLKAGSVLVYDFEKEQGPENMVNITRALESQLIGHRTQDGFGWIGVNILYPDRLAVQEDSPWAETEKWDEDKLLQEIQQDEQSKKVMEIIVSGLQEAKDDWLKIICINSWIDDASKDVLHQEFSEGSFIISKELKRRQYMQMMNLLKNKLDTLQKNRLPAYESNTVLARDYANDNRLCSIAGYNFAQIIKYLSDGKSGSQYAALAKYAENKLKSRRGTLFYLKADYPEKQFIAELLYAGLYIRHRGANK